MRTCARVRGESKCADSRMTDVDRVDTSLSQIQVSMVRPAARHEKKKEKRKEKEEAHSNGCYSTCV